MIGIQSFDGSLAGLLLDWLAATRWTEELFCLIREFAESVGPDIGKRPAFAADGEAAEAQRKGLREELERAADRAPDNPAYAALAARFSLSSVELALLRFFHLYLIFYALEQYVDKLPEWEAIKRVARYVGTPERALLEAIGPSSRLVFLGLGTTDAHALRLPKCGITFGLSEQVLSFIGAENTRSFASFLLESPATPPLPLSAHDLPDLTVAAARATLMSSRGKPVLLLYGKPGTGKSEFARSLSVACGYSPCFLRHNRRTGQRSYSDLLLAARLVDPAREVLVIDEADELLNLEPGLFGSAGSTDSIKKSMVNDFLDATTARIVFISNDTWRIPDSILRRFTFHLGFEDFGPLRRERVWNALDAETRVFSKKECGTLAASHKANPARIRQVIDVCAAMDRGVAAETFDHVAVAEEMLSRSDEIMYGIPRREEWAPRVYDPAFLNLAMPVEELVESLERWKAGFARDSRGINLLFYGAPGTGKTAFAMHIAELLGFRPVVKRASDLFSSWVGETEKKIRAAFREAEGTVLVFDEADSLLSSRELAQYGWERSQTNEVLTSMESFKGLFIASTNFRKILDTASLRRFTFKVEFRPTAPARRKDLVESYFPGMRLTDRDSSALGSLDTLTPGDVAVAARRLEYSGSCEAARVISALREEVEARGAHCARIGFGV